MNVVDLPENIVARGERISEDNYVLSCIKDGRGHVISQIWRDQDSLQRWQQERKIKENVISLPSLKLIILLLWGESRADYVVDSSDPNHYDLASVDVAVDLSVKYVLNLSDQNAVWPALEWLARQAGLDDKGIILLKHFSEQSPHVPARDLIAMATKVLSDPAQIARDQEETKSLESDLRKAVANLAETMGKDPNEAMIAWDTCRPPMRCDACQETVGIFLSLSPSRVSATWQCGYCKKRFIVQASSSINPSEQLGERMSISKLVQREVWKRDNGRCSHCGSQENLEFDHIIAVSRGGSNTTRNIQLLCEACNRAKSDKAPGNW